ncbi:hypothetical protein ACQP3J_32345, partial [Escherichia coli]
PRNTGAHLGTLFLTILSFTTPQRRLSTLTHHHLNYQNREGQGDIEIHSLGEEAKTQKKKRAPLTMELVQRFRASELSI